MRLFSGCSMFPADCIRPLFLSKLCPCILSVLWSWKICIVQSSTSPHSSSSSSSLYNHIVMVFVEMTTNKGGYLVSKRCHTSTTTKTWVAYSNFHLTPVCCLCDDFQVLIKSLVCWLCTGARGLVLFQILLKWLEEYFLLLYAIYFWTLRSWSLSHGSCFCMNLKIQICMHFYKL